MIEPYFVAYTCEQLRAVILMHEKPIQGHMSRKEYKKHLEQVERINQFLEQEKLNKQNDEKSL